MPNKQFVLVTIVTFIVIVIWIIADVLHTQPSVQVDPKLTTLLTPISPNFDQKVISQIKEVTPVEDLTPTPTITIQNQNPSTSSSQIKITLPSNVKLPPSLPPAPSPATASTLQGGIP
jgi:hypothetical protein